MKKQVFLKNFTVTFAILLLPALLLSFFLPLADAAEVYDGVIRLHVLAHSDDEKEQALKLCVRDAILHEMGTLFNGQSSKEGAEALLESSLDEVEKLAEKTLREKGCPHDVRVTLCKEYYPTREYEGMRLPAGEYLSLRVLIGDGVGQNWWCMVYPPLCTSSAEANEALSEAGFTPNQVRLLTDDEDGEYVIRFKIVETVSSLWEGVKGWFEE